MNKLGNILNKLRKEQNYSQEQLGEIIGVSHTSVKNWELGINEPKASYIIKLAELFNVSTDYLLGINTLELKKNNDNHVAIFTNNLKESRMVKGYKQKDIAKILNCSVNKYASWEQGRTEPSISDIIELAKLYNVTTDYLLGYMSTKPEIQMNNIGAIIKNLRKQRNLTYESLAESIGYSKATIGYWESNKKVPNAQAIIALADFFQVSADYLLGRADKYSVNTMSTSDFSTDQQYIVTEYNKLSAIDKQKIINFMMVSNTNLRNY